MAHILEELVEWTENYIKNKDVIAKQIASIMKNEEGWSFRVVKKQGQQFFLVAPHISSAESITSKMDKETEACLVVLNTKKNLDAIAGSWKELEKYPKLCIIFVNPRAEGEKRWIIFPNTHSKITDPNALKPGLESLFSTVEQYREA